MADKNGRLWDRPERIKVECLPYDDNCIDEMLDNLAKSDFILRYEVGDRKCIQVINFEKHQSLTSWEKSTSAEVPAPKHFRRTSEGLQKSVKRTSEGLQHNTVQNSKEQNSKEMNPPFHGVEFMTALLEFKQHRKEKRQSLTPTAERNLYRKLEPMGEARATAALRYSMAQGYSGVFEEGSNGNGKPSKVEQTMSAVERVIAKHERQQS